MKIFISADIEGVTGITDWAEADLSQPDNVEFRERMTAEVVAACEGALAAGATDIVVKDAHWTGRNLLAERLPRQARLLRAWSGHPWFAGSDARRDWAALRAQPLAGLGYHSPNLELTHARRLERAATASDQEGVATLVLSGAFVGFLPDHYAEPFVRAGRLRAVSPRLLNYECRFACIRRHAPAPLRVAQAFRECLLSAHA